MAPELALLYVAGLPATASLTALHAFLFKQKMNSVEMRNVQSNLRSVGKFWSDSEGKIKPFVNDDDVRKDQSAYYKTVLWLGIFCFGLSWVGFFLQLLVMFSIRYVAKPRMERQVFASTLAIKIIDAHNVEILINQLGS